MPIKKNVDKRFFKKWSPEMAYVLGFFFADGSYDINPRGSEYFSFQITDESLLRTIRKSLGSNHKIATRVQRQENESTQFRLQIGSKEMCADLRSYGVSVQKAGSMGMPSVPGQYLPAFVRGYFDGDGHVWMGEIHRNRKTKHMVLQVGFTSCSKSFLQGLQSSLRTLGIVGGSLYCKKNAFCIKYSTSDALRLHDIMYSTLREGGLLLTRKKIVFENYIKLRS